jgi:tetratricopeptide (TPR) repeat protein
MTGIHAHRYFALSLIILSLFAGKSFCSVSEPPACIRFDGNAFQSTYSRIEIPSDQEAFTKAKLDEVEKQFCRRHLIEKFEALADKSLPWYESAHDFLSRALVLLWRRPSAEEIKRLIEDGNKLDEAGCGEPAVLMCHGIALRYFGRFEQARDRYFEALKSLETSGYSPVVRYYCTIRLAWIFYRLDDSRNKIKWRDRAFELLARAAAEGAFEKHEERFVIKYAREWRYLFPSKEWQKIYEIFQKQDGVPPWIQKVIAGEALIEKGWDARGEGAAYTVTEEGWGVFGDSLEEAARLLTEAWEMHPEYPEAAARMITCTMAGRGGDDVISFCCGNGI